MRGLAVADVPGVVTAVHNQGLWMQDLAPDNKPETSEGVYVYLADQPKLVPGDTVNVSGTVAEVRTGGEDSGNLTVTEIVRAKVRRTGSAELPKPIRIGRSGATVPGQIRATTASGIEPVDIERSPRFDRDHNAVDTFEALEGMRVQIDDAVAIGPTDGQLPVWPSAPVPEGIQTPTGSVLSTAARAQTGRVMLGDTLAPLPVANTGDVLPGAITGVWHYAAGNYALLPDHTPKLRPTNLQQQTASAPAENQLTIAALDASRAELGADDPVLQRLGGLIANNLRQPDIIVVTGMPDDSGKKNDQTVSGAASFAALTAAASPAGKVRYEYQQLDPSDNADSPQPGLNRRTGFLFRPDTARFINRGQPSATAATSVGVNNGRAELNHSPGRIAPDSDAFKGASKQLVGEFDINGTPLFVIGLDLVSAMNTAGADHDSPLYGRYQPSHTPSEPQREAQAREVHEFTARLSNTSKTARVVALGQIHDGPTSQPVSKLVADGVLHAAADTLPEMQRYSCVVDGVAVLDDQAFSSPNVGGTSYAIVHTSAEFADRPTDHDPQLLRIRASAG